MINTFYGYTEIRNGKVLRKTPQPQPALTSTLRHSQEHDLQLEASSALVNVLASRRAHISDDESEQDEDEEEEMDWMWV
jgi:hypothetical protein